MKKLGKILLWPLFCAISFVVPVTIIADVEIILKDGKIFTLPVEAEQIKSITVDDNQYYPDPEQLKATSKKAASSPPARSRPASARTSGKEKIIRVGPGRDIELPSKAARIAKDGDVIEIDAAEYFGDVAVWGSDNLVLRGVGGRPHLNAGGNSAEGKAIWVINGNNVTVENIEFSNAKVHDKNGAGIRLQGNNLMVRNCVFRDNENGLLTGNNPNRSLLIEYSTFAGNGYGDGQSHGIYVGSIKQLTFQYNYVHHTKTGHQVKSGAKKNFILYNKLVDEKSGTSSYAIDMYNGHFALVIGNILQQSQSTDNYSLVHFAAKLKRPGSALYLVNNTVINNRHDGVFLNNRSPIDAKIINNVLAGNIDLVTGRGSGDGNVRLDFSQFVDPQNYDFPLKPGASAIDAGVDPGRAGTVSLRPRQEYVHAARNRERPVIGQLDAGAFEFQER
jgi:hypothetical protein